MKKKFFLAIILFVGFVFALSIFSKDSAQTLKETSLKSRPTAKSDRVVYSGENDFWKASFSVSKKSKNQLELTHVEGDRPLPQELTFTLNTSYDRSRKHTQIGTYKLTFPAFPKHLILSFDQESKLSTENKKLVLKITGTDHYQFFNLYKEE